MPPTKASGFIHTKDPLSIDEIADVQNIRDETTRIIFTHEHQYKGVLFVMVDAEQQESSEDEDWTNDSKHLVRSCNLNIDESKKLDDEEKARVKLLMKQYKILKPEDFKQYNHELASLLNKAFKASFDVQILHDFTKARKNNFKFSGLQTSARFAAWWKNRKAKKRSRSLEKRVPRNV